TDQPAADDDPLDGESLPALFGEPGQPTSNAASSTEQHSGIAISGAATVNDLHKDKTLAFISHNVEVETEGALKIEATGSLFIVGVSGVTAFATKDSKDPSSKDGSALAGAFVFNNLQEDDDGNLRQVLAYTEDVDLHAGSLEVSAHNTTDVWSFGVGGAFAGAE